jgi:ribosomal protein S13
MTGWDKSTGTFYADFVSKQTNLPSTTLISSLNETQLNSVMDAIETMEHTEAGLTFKCGDAGNPQWVKDLLLCD